MDCKIGQKKIGIQEPLEIILEIAILGRMLQIASIQSLLRMERSLALEKYVMIVSTLKQEILR